MSYFTISPKSLLAGALILLSACGQVQTPSSPPDVSSYNELQNFYQANLAALNYTPAPKTTDPLYLLVDWNNAEPTLTSYINKGYLLLGHCSFVGGMLYGTPQRQEAIDYGKHLGADLVIYATQSSADGNRIEHYVAFLAKKG